MVGSKINTSFICYLIGVKYICEHYFGLLTYYCCIEKLNGLLKNESYFIDHESFILFQNSIGVLYFDNKENEKAIKIFESIISERLQFCDDKFNSTLYYNYAMKKMSSFEKGIEFAYKSLRLAGYSGRGVLCGPLYYILGECEKGMHDDFVSIKQCFEKALFYFTEYGREDLIEILKKEQEFYLADIPFKRKG